MSRRESSRPPVCAGFVFLFCSTFHPIFSPGAPTSSSDLNQVEENEKGIEGEQQVEGGGKEKQDHRDTSHNTTKDSKLESHHSNLKKGKQPAPGMCKLYISFLLHFPSCIFPSSPDVLV